MIVTSAIEMDGKIYTSLSKSPCRHSDIIIEYAGKIRFPHYKAIQGFLTDNNRFLSRSQAAEHAFQCGQIKEPTNTILSEDLWQGEL